MSDRNVNEQLMTNFRKKLKEIKSKQNRLVERLREVETEENRLREEMNTLEESAKKITDAIHSILAIDESNKEKPRNFYDEDDLFDEFEDYENLNNLRREEQYGRNNGVRNNRNNQMSRDNRNDYINPNNRRNQNYQRNDYKNDTVAYFRSNQPRNVPMVSQNIEPLSQRFADRTITQACTLLLRESNGALHVNELYNYLVEGGFEFKGNNPTISIAVSLNRNRRFKKVAPGTFDLVIRDASQAAS